jgi:hypothetical protein
MRRSKARALLSPRSLATYLTAVALSVCCLGSTSVPAWATTGYQELGSFETTGIKPQQVAADQTSGNLYVATFAAPPGLFGPGDIELFDASGNTLNSFGSAEEARFSGVALDPTTHHVYAYDSHHQALGAFDASGHPINAFEGGSAPSLPTSGGEGPVQIATDANGDIYYPNQALEQVQEFRPDGTPGPVTILGTTTPTDVAVTPARIYVVDVNPSSGATQVQQFDASGVPVGTGPLGNGVLTEPKALAVDSNGDVFVIDQGSGGVVDEFNSAGLLIRMFAVGKLTAAASIAVNSASGQIYVAESGFLSHGPVLIFGPSTKSVPSSSTGTATAIDPTGEQVTGTVNPQGSATGYHFEYGRTASYGNDAPAPDAVTGSGSANIPVNTTLSGLEPNQTYHYRLVATNAEGDRTYGTDATFTTLSAAPSVSGEATSGTTQTGATLEAQVNPNNQPTTYYFEYGTSPTLSEASAVPAPPGPEAGAGYGNQTAGQAIEGLSPNTTYYYRALATNSTGKTEGPIESFTTPPLAPLADAEAASSITQTTATLNATLTTQDAETSYRFQYVADAEFQNSGYERATSMPEPEPHVSASPTTTPVATGVSGLEPGTVYHVRVVASSAGGVSTSGERTFATLILRPAATTGLPVDVTPTSATVQAGVNPEGGAATYLFHYGQTTAYGASTPAGGVVANTEPQAVTATFTGLAPHTTYHYRILATNSSGTTEGQDESLTTPPEGSPPAPGVSPFGAGGSIPLPTGPYGLLTGLAPTPPSSTRDGAPASLTVTQKLSRAIKACAKLKSKPRKRTCLERARRKYRVKAKRNAGRAG